jgi:carbon monoxide dehydrogenase subunit G
MRRFLPFIIGITFLFTGNAYAFEKLNLNIDKKKLDAGKLQTFTIEMKGEGEGKKKRGVGVLLINAPTEKVWKYLCEWETMGEYVPGLEYYKTVKVIKPIEKSVVGEYMIEGKLKFPILTVVYTLDIKFDESNMRQEWSLITPAQEEESKKQGKKMTRATGGLKNVEGFEYIEPYDDGKKTVYYYAPIVETSVPVPGFAERFLTKSTLPGYMEGVKKRVESDGKYKK